MIKDGRNLKIGMLELSHEEFTIGSLREASIWEHVAQCSSYTEKSISVTCSPLIWNTEEIKSIRL